MNFSTAPRIWRALEAQGYSCIRMGVSDYGNMVMVTFDAVGQHGVSGYGDTVELALLNCETKIRKPEKPPSRPSPSVSFKEGARQDKKRRSLEDLLG